MVKNVFFRMTQIHPVALVTFSWVAFVFGLIINSTSLKLVLLAAARVLP